MVSCLEPCEEIEHLDFKNYTILKYKCPDMVLSHFYKYKIFENGNADGHHITRKDSCSFAWQAKNDKFLKINLCLNEITEKSPEKKLLLRNQIDSILIFSGSEKKLKRFSQEQIQNFVIDWNNKLVRNYSDRPYDSAFSYIEPYQYKIDVFSSSNTFEVFGYNYLILDSSNWVYKITDNKNLDYFHEIWELAK